MPNPINRSSHPKRYVEKDLFAFSLLDPDFLKHHYFTKETKISLVLMSLLYF